MAMHNKNKAVGVVGTIPRNYEWLYFIKYKNDMPPPVPLQKLYKPFSLWAITIKIKSTHLMDF